MTAFPSSLAQASTIPASGARLLADIGGTNARFALETGPGRFEAIEVLSCQEHASLADAIRAYLALPQVAGRAGGLRHAAIAIANPVTGDHVRMTNHHWAFSIEALRQECGFATLVVVNDFSALARSLPHLGEHKRQIGGGAPVADAPLGLLGAGTGLGVSGLIPAPGGAGWTALRSEGGHTSFSPVNELEVAILQYAWREFEHVSSERLLSGAGVELIYRALSERAGRPDSLSAPEISRRALEGECAVCDAVLDAFCGMLGTAAGNLAITLGAQGGVYIGGGIVPRLGERFVQSSFRRRFEQKGRFSAYLAQVPTYLITAEYPAFLGVSAILSEKLATA